jgi:hypothetical protein
LNDCCNICAAARVDRILLFIGNQLLCMRSQVSQQSWLSYREMFLQKGEAAAVAVTSQFRHAGAWVHIHTGIVVISTAVAFLPGAVRIASLCLLASPSPSTLPSAQAMC